MQHCLVDSYKVCSDHGLWVKICPSPGVTCFTQRYIIIGKNFTNLLRTNWKTGSLDIWYVALPSGLLESFFSNHGPRVKKQSSANCNLKKQSVYRPSWASCFLRSGKGNHYYKQVSDIVFYSYLQIRITIQHARMESMEVFH